MKRATKKPLVLGEGKKLLILTFTLILLLCAILALNTSAETVASGDCGAEGDNVTWAIDDTGTLTISGTGEMQDFSNALFMPWEDYKRYITTLIINNGVTNISGSAFSDFRKLTDITISDSVTNIGDYAFSLCRNLTTVTIPESVTSIGESVFDRCESLTTVTIPESVTSIGDYAFDRCESLATITIPGSVTSIGDFVFRNCDSLTSINVVSNNTKYLSSNGILFNKSCTELICYPTGKSNTYYSIPDTITNILDYAFWKNSSLTSIAIPKSVTSIGEYAFCYLSNLTTINVNTSNTKYLSSNGILFSKDYTKIICYPAGKSNAHYSIPAGVTDIGSYAFCSCINLTKIAIPNSVKNIGDYAFCECYNLTNITLSNNITGIGESAFRHCYSLKSVTIPSSITDISRYAFDECYNLTTVIYTGTKEEWETLYYNAHAGNDYLLNANIIFKNNQPFTSTTTIVTGSGTSFDISAYNITENNYIVIGIYKDNKLVDLQKEKYVGNDVTFNSAYEYDTAKVMVWKDLATAEPEGKVEIIEK